MLHASMLPRTSVTMIGNVRASSTTAAPQRSERFGCRQRNMTESITEKKRILSKQAGHYILMRLRLMLICPYFALSIASLCQNSCVVKN